MKGEAPLETPKRLCKAHSLQFCSYFAELTITSQCRAFKGRQTAFIVFRQYFGVPCPKKLPKNRLFAFKEESAMPTLLTHATHAERRLANLFRATRWPWAGWAKPRGSFS